MLEDIAAHLLHQDAITDEEMVRIAGPQPR
jgi:hypothetical protein